MRSCCSTMLSDPVKPVAIKNLSQVRNALPWVEFVVRQIRRRARRAAVVFFGYALREPSCGWFRKSVF